jgi:hypothetical protein
MDLLRGRKRFGRKAEVIAQNLKVPAGEPADGFVAVSVNIDLRMTQGESMRESAQHTQGGE